MADKPLSQAEIDLRRNCLFLGLSVEAVAQAADLLGMPAKDLVYALSTATERL